MSREFCQLGQSSQFGESTEVTAISPIAPVRAGRSVGLPHRIWAAVVASGCAMVLGLAAWMTPSPTGIGTHHQMLGLPPCGWIAAADLPCPTCGMTTAFAHAAEGNLLASFQAQPVGAALALGTAMALLVGIYVAVTGSTLARSFGRLWGRRAAWGLSLVFLAAWGWKIITYKGWL